MFILRKQNNNNQICAVLSIEGTAVLLPSASYKQVKIWLKQWVFRLTNPTSASYQQVKLTPFFYCRLISIRGYLLPGVRLGRRRGHRGWWF